MLIRFREVLIAHIIISAVYYLYARLRTGNNTQSASEGAIVFAIPLFGVLFLLGVRLAQWLNAGKEHARTDIYHQYASDYLIMGEHEQYEDDIISLSDVLMMDDARQKRVLLTDAVKHDALRNKKLLHRAVRDNDREVAHYAVSMVTTVVEGMERRLFVLREEMRKNPDDQAALTEFVSVMKEFLSTGFLDATLRRKTENEYADALERLIERTPDNIDMLDIFVTKINLEMGFGDYGKAEHYCKLFAQKFPSSEEPFISYIKLYQNMQDYGKFRGKIDELKKFPIQLTARALAIIRFWEQEKKYV